MLCSFTSISVFACIPSALNDFNKQIIHRRDSTWYVISSRALKKILVISYSINIAPPSPPTPLSEKVWNHVEPSWNSQTMNYQKNILRNLYIVYIVYIVATLGQQACSLDAELALSPIHCSALGQVKQGTERCDHFNVYKRIYFFVYKRNWVFAKNSDFLICISSVPNFLDLRDISKYWILIGIRKFEFAAKT